MLRFVAYRLLVAIPTAWAIATLAFLAVHLAPGDVADTLLQQDASPEQAEQIRSNLGLDRPLIEQYLSWFGGLFRGDLGESFVNGRSVAQDLIDRLPATIELTVGGLVVALAIALPAGTVAGAMRGRWPDNVIRLGAFTGVSIPSFWLALILVLVFAVGLGWFPSSGYTPFFVDPAQSLRQLFLPALTLGFVMAGTITRMLRASVIDSLSQEYVRVAHAKGVPNSAVIRKHALRTALIPSITIVGLQVGHLIGGTVVLEKVFSWPGNGRYLLDAIAARDYPVVQASIVFYGLLFIVINIVVDVLYGVADPRVRRT